MRKVNYTSGVSFHKILISTSVPGRKIATNYSPTPSRSLKKCFEASLKGCASNVGWVKIRLQEPKKPELAGAYGPSMDPETPLMCNLLFSFFLDDPVQCIQHYQLAMIPLGGSGNLVIRAHLILLVISTLANIWCILYYYLHGNIANIILVISTLANECILIWFCFDSDILISAIFNGAKICIQDLLCVKTLPFATVNRCDGGGRCCWNNLFLWFEFGCKSNVNCHKLSSPPDSTRNRYIFYISLLLQSCGTWPNVQFHTGVKLL